MKALGWEFLVTHHVPVIVMDKGNKYSGTAKTYSKTAKENKPWQGFTRVERGQPRVHSRRARALRRSAKGRFCPRCRAM